MLAMPIPDVSGALRFNSIDYDCRMSSHNRKQRRAARARDRGGEQEVRSLGSPIREQIDRLGSLGGFANHVSMALTGLPTSTSGMLASMVFAKCCAHARSIGAIALQSSMFDHHAIMALARMIMEASTMIAYLLDPVPDEEREFRHSRCLCVQERADTEPRQGQRRDCVPRCQRARIRSRGAGSGNPDAPYPARRVQAARRSGADPRRTQHPGGAFPARGCAGALFRRFL